MNEIQWQKSSFSSEGNNCVELGTSPTLDAAVLMRESDSPEVVLTSTRERLTRLLAAVRAGKLDQP